METLCRKQEKELMADRNRKIEDLARLGQWIISFPPDLIEAIHKSVYHNTWFTADTVRQSLTAIAEAFLNEDALKKWLDKYPDIHVVPKKVGLILAGNIPLVGFHDVLTVFLSGHRALIKLSDKDKFLLPFLISKLTEFNGAYTPSFELVERMEDYDAVIATGSNASGTYFEKYFSHVPHIIRKNRNAVAILFNDTSEANLTHLGADVFDYYGLGCRNVSKLFLEKGFDISRIFRAFEKYKDVMHHNKYMNNYDYNNAMYLLNNETFLTNNFVILKEDEDIASRIATIHYSYFESSADLTGLLQKQKEKIQCIITDRDIESMQTVKMGLAQMPGLSDYADGVDTMSFLNQL